MLYFMREPILLTAGNTNGDRLDDLVDLGSRNSSIRGLTDCKRCKKLQNDDQLLASGSK